VGHHWGRRGARGAWGRRKEDAAISGELVIPVPAAADASDLLRAAAIDSSSEAIDAVVASVSRGVAGVARRAAERKAAASECLEFGHISIEPALVESSSGSQTISMLVPPGVPFLALGFATDVRPPDESKASPGVPLAIGLRDGDAPIDRRGQDEPPVGRPSARPWGVLVSSLLVPRLWEPGLMVFWSTRSSCNAVVQLRLVAFGYWMLPMAPMHQAVGSRSISAPVPTGGGETDSQDRHPADESDGGTVNSQGAAEDDAAAAALAEMWTQVSRWVTPNTDILLNFVEAEAMLPKGASAIRVGRGRARDPASPYYPLSLPGMWIRRKGYKLSGVVAVLLGLEGSTGVDSAMAKRTVEQAAAQDPSSRSPR